MNVAPWQASSDELSIATLSVSAIDSVAPAAICVPTPDWSVYVTPVLAVQPASLEVMVPSPAIVVTLTGYGLLFLTSTFRSPLAPGNSWAVGVPAVTTRPFWVSAFAAPLPVPDDSHAALANAPVTATATTATATRTSLNETSAWGMGPPGR